MDRLTIRLLDEGWTLNDIESMDIVRYIEVRAIQMRAEEAPRMVYIDEIL